MGDKYGECQKSHERLGGKTDGCLEYVQGWRDSDECDVCGCGQKFHRKVVKYKTEVVYTKCHKIFDFNHHISVDGCQEFMPSGNEGTAGALTCAVCGCHKGFHRNEVTTPVTST